MFGTCPPFPAPVRSRPRAMVAACVALLAASSCFSPDLTVTDCTIPCLEDCPSGSECRNNFCVRNDSAATCAEGGSGGSAGASSPTAGTGAGGEAGAVDSAGRGGASAGNGGNSGSTGLAGNAGLGGSAGLGGGTANPLALHGAASQSLCPNQMFDLELSADGGVAPYTWSLASADSAAGVTLSATTGASVHANGQASASLPSLQVTVQDATGASATDTVSFDILATGQDLCPTIDSRDLPPACIAHDYYAADITVVGGTKPFTWTALSLPDGLVFDANTQVISGTALAESADTPLTLQVTDSLGRQTQRTYPLTFRDKCWFGFTSTEAGISQLHLFDPAFSTRAPVLEAASENVGVLDFAFSPDGSALVYRRSSNTGFQDLVLAKAPSWQSQVLDLGGSVLEYSWSPSSSAVAATIQDSAGDTLLGGYNVASSSALVPASIFDSAAGAAPLDSKLLWFKAAPYDYVAFHGDAFPGSATGLEYPYYARLDDTGFSAVNQWALIGYLNTGDPQSEVQLLPAQRGIFAVDPLATQLDFFGTASDKDYDSYLKGYTVTSVADPAGAYVATRTSQKLQVFMTSESGGTTDPPTAWTPSLDDCATIMAWDVSKERIACDASITVGNAPPTGEVRLFDLAGYSSSPQLTMTAIKNLSGFQQGASVSHPRSFSPSGAWFAFTTDTKLYLADVRQAPQMQQTLLALPSALASDPGALAFSPDEKLLLWQLAGQFAVVVLEPNGPTGWFGTQNTLSAPDPCAEDFNTNPGAWCGSLSRTHAPVWASDSRYAAAELVGHTLRIYDLGRYVSQGATPMVDACEVGCSGNFAFQP